MDDEWLVTSVSTDRLHTGTYDEYKFRLITLKN